MSSELSHNRGDMASDASLPGKSGKSAGSETSSGRQRIPLVIGASVGFAFLFFAIHVNGVLVELSHPGELFPTSLDWIWGLIVLAGLIMSIVATFSSLIVRKTGEASYLILVLAGLIISAVITTILVLDYLTFSAELFAVEGDYLWPDGRPTYFFPVSVLGITLSMVSLVLIRGSGRLDQIISVFSSCVPIGLMSIPFLLNFGGSEIMRWMPMIIGLSGIALIFSGLRLRTYLTRVTFEATERASARVYVVTLVSMGVLAWILLDADEQLSPSADAVWILLLLGNTVMSVTLFAVLLRSGLDTNSTIALLLTVAALGLSAGLLAIFTLAVPDVVVFTRSLLLHLLSIVGMGLLLLAFTVKTIGTRVDRLIGFLIAAAPAVTLTVFVVDALATSANLTYSPHLFSGGYAFAFYLAFALSVLIWRLWVGPFRTTQWPVVREKLRLLLSRLKRVAKDVLRNPMGFVGTTILIFFSVIAVFGPVIAPYEVDATKPGLFESYLSPSPEHWMGTDVFGHDILSSLLYGARTSIIVGMFAAVIASVVGATVGLFSGYAGGWKDEVLMRINDVMLSIPWLVLMILIAGLIGTISLTAIILIIGLTGWSGTARLVRAQVLSLRERQYIERARAIGSGDLHIIKTHILPNSFPLVFANTILTVAISILSEATLSFLHMRPYGTVTWGTMLSYAYDCSAFQLGLHYWIVMPGLCIVFLVLGFTLLGYALDEVLNPRLRKR